MKKIILSLTLTSSLLFATNGDNLIGFGAKSRAMGGVGIATYFGSENILSNAALISKLKQSELDVGITYFTPSINTNGEKSKADKNFIPYVSYAKKYNENFTYGLGMYGSSGMGVDFQDSTNPSLIKSRTNLIIMKITPSVAYDFGDFSFGFAPIIQYGSLKVSYDFMEPVGGDKGTDFGLGFKVGFIYDVTSDLTLGANYQSAINMTYKNTLHTASTPFGLSISDDLEQPAELGFGVSYDMGPINLSADYKKIQWGKAKGYKEFGWADQDVYALGIKYEKDKTWYALGYNYGKNPITKDYSTVPTIINAFNYIFFPATQERHYTLGAGTEISKNLSVGINFVYGVEKTVKASGATGPIDVSHKETSANISLKYLF